MGNRSSLEACYGLFMPYCGNSDDDLAVGAVSYLLSHVTGSNLQDFYRETFHPHILDGFP